MSVKFKVEMTPKYMFDFMLYHQYTHFSGLLGGIIGVIALGLGISTMMDGETSAAMPALMVAILFLIINPMTMKQRANTQVKNAFKEPLEYEFTEEGIFVRQGEAEALNKWDEFSKAVSTQKSVILYISRNRAIVLPKECMGDQYETTLKMIHTHMAPGKVKIRHIH